MGVLRAAVLLFFNLLFIVHLSFGKQQAGSVSPEVATIGILVNNVYELNMSENSFYADFYLWCRWKGSIDPLKDLEFVNSEEQWGFTKTELYEKPEELKDGELYNCYHIQGKFRHSFILNNYPIDFQNLNIELENSFYTSKQLVYKADAKNSKLQPGVLIPGWTIEKFGNNSRNHKYSSNFGLPEVDGNDTYSNLSFSFKLYRPVEFFIWKLLLPLLIVLLSSLGTTIIFPGYVDARIYSPVGALLTTVFLQQSYSSQLPDISYLILTDKIYVVVYVAILTGIFHAIYTANLVKDPNEENVRKAKKLDKIYLITTVLFLLGASCLLFF